MPTPKRPTEKRLGWERNPRSSHERSMRRSNNQNSSQLHVNSQIRVSHAYAEKADGKKAGVGTESQIISREVYEKVEQSKFIPIACEFSDQGEPCLRRKGRRKKGWGGNGIPDHLTRGL